MQQNYQGNYPSNYPNQNNYQGNCQDGTRDLHRSTPQVAQGMDYTVDMVFCIDATGSMEDDFGGPKRIINMVKENALNFYDDFSNMMQSKSKRVRQLRIRVVAFRDYIADQEKAMLVTNFFSLPQQASEFEACINSINAMGGGDIPEDGLEALAYAIRSDWTKEGAKKRQVIVVWTDAGTHPLGFGKTSRFYPGGMPETMSQLSDWWDEYMHPNYKRLVIFAPDEPGWSYISENWDNVVHFPSVAGNGLAEQSYADIMNVLGNSI